jgi:sugar phosphate isomerase/epimerase
MKLGYSTYAMKDLDVFEAVPRIHDLGYEFLEISARSQWPTSAENFDQPSRARLVKTLQKCGFPPAPLMAELPSCVPDSDWSTSVASFELTCMLARDLNFGSTSAVVTCTLGSCPSPWEKHREAVCDAMLRLADLADRYHVVVAVEPHAGIAFDTPEKAVWLMENTDHPAIKLNFDMSHFKVLGLDMQHCVDLCVPYAAHAHIKDGRMEEGTIRYLLPGEGNLDLPAFFAAVTRGGLAVPVTVEVSAMIWNQSDYEPWTTAAKCFSVLDDARKAATSMMRG